MMKVYVGERVTLRFRVDNREGKEFTVSDADYTVFVGGSAMASGKMNIKDGRELSFVFAPENPGVHRVSVWYDIETDRRKAEFPVEVVA